ncbi:hypothetical protein [Butyrivibrio sp. VCB2006]|uniref:hypothetical protein n=1 Tax=Butyrivibrio sp. VCB2006 TaxID=1280679 RepID=UPI000406CEED|nr:hypothetical protein [Butyrivibrio sp. VCB2006]
MKDFSVVMALVDFVPVLFFAIAAVRLQRDLYNKMSKGAFALFATGTINVVFAGCSKALYKLLYAARVCDFEALNNLYFPVISVGFLLAGIGLVGMLTHKQTENAALSVMPPVLFTGTPIMICFMIIGLGMICYVLCAMAHRLKKSAIMILFIINFLCCLGMGYLASKDFDVAIWNWIGEGINILGQGAFLLGVIRLRKAGLVELKLNK